MSGRQYRYIWLICVLKCSIIFPFRFYCLYYSFIVQFLLKLSEIHSFLMANYFLLELESYTAAVFKLKGFIMNTLPRVKKDSPAFTFNTFLIRFSILPTLFTVIWNITVQMIENDTSFSSFSLISFEFST